MKKLKLGRTGLDISQVILGGGWVGGLFIDPEKALERAKLLIDQGVDILDIGAQSTRPGAYEIGAKEELRRLLPVLKIIREEYPNILISIDTFSSKVASEAITLGANWINDVSGGRIDENILKVVAEVNCPYVLTHSRGNSLTMDKLTNYKILINP